VHIALSTKIYS